MIEPQLNTDPGMVFPGTRCNFQVDVTYAGHPQRCGRPAWGIHRDLREAYCWRHYVDVDQAVTA